MMGGNSRFFTRFGSLREAHRGGKMAEEIILNGKNYTVEQLVEENRVLKETNQMLSDMVDTYDKELRNMTDMLEKTTDCLNKANEIIENSNRPEVRRIDV